MKNILLGLAFFITFLITFDLFLKEPPVWPDEASLVYLSTLNPSILENFKIYPSIYVPAISLLFKIFGISIEAQRLLSLVAGFGSVIIFILILLNISKIYFKESFLKFVPVALLITDFTFLQSTRAGRPEIFTLLFGLISTHLILQFINRNKIIYLVFGFLSAVIAFLFHVNGLIYLISFFATAGFFYKKLGRKVIFFISLIFLLSIFLLIVALFPSLKSILSRVDVSNGQATWIFTVFISKPLELRLAYLSFMIIGILYLCLTIYKKQISIIVLIFPLIFSWIVLLLNKDFWYAVYIIPYTYLVLYALLESYYQKWHKNQATNNKYKLIFLLSLAIIIFLSNLKFHTSILISEGGDRYSYPNYIQGIKQVIPDNATVFTSAIPDPYYAFVNRKNNRIFRFPQSFAQKNIYVTELNDTDYIIYNGPYGNNYYGNIVADYIKINFKKVTQIGGPDQYQALIVELKPKSERVNPK